MQDSEIVQIIRHRDRLLDYHCVIPIKYYVKKTLGIGNDGIRELQLYLETQQIMFPNSKGLMISLPIGDIVSVSPTENPASLLVNFRVQDKTVLKEKRWTFLSVEDAALFKQIVNGMNSIGPIVQESFSLIDKDAKGYVTAEDIDIALHLYVSDHTDFTEGSTFLMVDECYTGKNEGQVSCGVLLSLMISADIGRVQSLASMLEEWLRVASERINTLYSYRDSRGGYEDVDDITFEFDEDFPNPNEKMSMNTSLPPPVIDDESIGSREREPSVNRKRLSIRSMRVKKTLFGAATPVVSIISKPRSSACTTGSNVTDLVPGEIVLTTLHQVLFTLGPPSKDKIGFKAYADVTLLLTNYRLVLADEQGLAAREMGKEETEFRYGAPLHPLIHSIPLACICRIELEPDGGGVVSGYELALVCKDLRVVRLAFAGNAVDTFPSFFSQVLASCAFTGNVTDLFAFRAHKINPVAASASILAKEAAFAIIERSNKIRPIADDREKSDPAIVALTSETDRVSIAGPEFGIAGGQPSPSVTPIPAWETPHIVDPIPAPSLPVERRQSDRALSYVPHFSLPPARPSQTIAVDKMRLTLAQQKANSDGWTLFDPAYEYYRQGLLSHPDYSNSSTRSRMPGTAQDSTIPPAGPYWRLWSDGYQLSDTYPSAFILPSALTNREVFDAAMFRSRCRLPALTWREPRNGACLVRSSQPMSGLSSQTNVADKLLLNLYRMRGNPHDIQEQRFPSVFYVIDCRSQLAANANAAFGKGVENWKALVNTRVHFCNIANIHTMRSSLENLQKVLAPWTPAKGNKASTAITAGGLQILQTLKKAFASGKDDPSGNASPGTSDSRGRTMTEYSNRTTSTASSANAARDGGLETSQGNDDSRFLLSRIEDTGWLEHVRLVLAGSILVAEKLSLEGCGVLVHCSDGWDRTAQVSSTAQLILDPYFRTIRGFFVLIEKDWCGFGHKFQDRIGHGRSSLGEEAKETSPVFVQWLDVVSQMLYQFPNHFEFSEDMLVLIADALHSCQFGTFLGNTEKERKVDLKAVTSTNSLWTYLLQPTIITRYLNPHYNAASQVGVPVGITSRADSRSASPAPGGGHHGIASSVSSGSLAGGSSSNSAPNGSVSSAIWPSPRRVRLWERYFCRWDLDMHPRVGSGETWKDTFA